jgi:uncharacterized protein (DUF1015 family)
VAKIKPFRGVRPIPEKAAAIASRPYDVLNKSEAREAAKDNPYSFLHVVKPEIDLPDDTDPYSEQVYLKGRDNFRRMVAEGLLLQDEASCLYLYELISGDRSQVGLVACAAIDDYFDDVIKKHELTRPDKETDRKNHVKTGRMNAEPVFFSYPALEKIDDLARQVQTEAPEYDFVADDGIRHRFWVIKSESQIDAFIKAFSALPATYVADGHHRTAAAALAGREFRKQDDNPTGEKEYDYFLAVHFPDNQLSIIDYNRVVKDLNGHGEEEFLDLVRKSFEVTDHGPRPFKPDRLHQIGMYLSGRWFELNAREGAYRDDPIGVLDVTVLSEQILKPLLAIQDLRTDKRIDFVGGVRGLGELKKRVDSGEMKVAFALFPVTMKQLMDIADRDEIMPPKTTWFEPKLRSGLIVHLLD